MPMDALPIPPARAHEGAVRLHREYRDALGRPMAGQVRIAGAARSQDGHRVVVQAAVGVELVGGVLDVQLPPGDYALTATLTTVDGNRADDTETLTLEAPA